MSSKNVCKLMLMLVACVAVQFAVFWATGRTPRHVSNVVIKGKY